MPHLILFESNILSNPVDILNIIEIYINKGYDLIDTNKNDTLLKLNLNKIKNKTKFTNEIISYYIMDYPHNYNPESPPHDNTLESAKEYCIKNNYSGITYQYGRYEIRSGPYINYYNDLELISWVYL